MSYNLFKQSRCLKFLSISEAVSKKKKITYINYNGITPVPLFGNVESIEKDKAYAIAIAKIKQAKADDIEKYGFVQNKYFLEDFGYLQLNTGNKLLIGVSNIKNILKIRSVCDIINVCISIIHVGLIGLFVITPIMTIFGWGFYILYILHKIPLIFATKAPNFFPEVDEDNLVRFPLVNITVDYIIIPFICFFTIVYLMARIG